MIIRGKVLGDDDADGENSKSAKGVKNMCVFGGTVSGTQLAELPAMALIVAPKTSQGVQVLQQHIT